MSAFMKLAREIDEYSSRDEFVENNALSSPAFMKLAMEITSRRQMFLVRHAVQRLPVDRAVH